MYSKALLSNEVSSSFYLRGEPNLSAPSFPSAGAHTKDVTFLSSLCYLLLQLRTPQEPKWWGMQTIEASTVNGVMMTLKQIAAGGLM